MGHNAWTSYIVGERWNIIFDIKPIRGHRILMDGLPGVIVDGPEGPVQTAVFEIDGDAVRALYIVRNPDKLRHLPVAAGP